MRKKPRETGSRYAGKSAVKTFLCYSKKVFKILLDFIWPQFCLNCHSEGSLCCGFCLNDIILSEPKPIYWPTSEKIYFKACYCSCDYQNKLVQRLIKNYKYNYLENMVEPLLDILEKQARHLTLSKDTLIVNIPLHQNKKRKRGFDQTELLAKKLASRLNLAYSPLLVRSKDNKPQAQLNKTAREKNALGIFKINKNTADQLAGRYSKILLIDDVTSTGTTLNQAAKILAENNYPNIICLVLAKNK